MSKKPKKAKVAKLPHEDQHFVPQSYTKAWHDPEFPASATVRPFVWKFTKDGSGRDDAYPVSLFTEKEMYTVHGLNGERDLSLEHAFGKLEDRFTRIRNLKFKTRQWPDEQEVLQVHEFIAASQIRTQTFRDFHRAQFAEIRKDMEELQVLTQAAMLDNDVTIPDGKGNEIGIADLKSYEDYPVQYTLAEFLPQIVRIYSQMHMAVLCSDDPIGFVTTDAPCTWYDPATAQIPSHLHELMSETVEVTFPISPQLCLFLTRRNRGGAYIDVPSEKVHELNRRHIGQCDKTFISCRRDTLPAWFEEPSVPKISREIRTAGDDGKDFAA